MKCSNKRIMGSFLENKKSLRRTPALLLRTLVCRARVNMGCKHVLSEGGDENGTPFSIKRACSRGTFLNNKEDTFQMNRD